MASFFVIFMTYSNVTVSRNFVNFLGVFRAASFVIFHGILKFCCVSARTHVFVNLF